MNLRRRGRRKVEPGLLLAGLDKGGTAARPLDGGVLTRWGARAPARGPTTAPRSLHRPLAHSVSSRSLLVTLREKRAALRDKEERKVENENDLGFSPGSAASGFYPSETVGRPSDVIRRRSAIGPNSAQAGASVGPLSWPRPRLRPGCGGERGTVRVLEWAGPL